MDELFLLRTQIKSLEAVLAGALRREQAAESSAKKSATEIEHLTRLVGQLTGSCLALKSHRKGNLGGIK